MLYEINKKTGELQKFLFASYEAERELIIDLMRQLETKYKVLVTSQKEMFDIAAFAIFDTTKIAVLYDTSNSKRIKFLCDSNRFKIWECLYVREDNSFDAREMLRQIIRHYTNVTTGGTDEHKNAGLEIAMSYYNWSKYWVKHGNFPIFYINSDGYIETISKHDILESIGINNTHCTINEIYYLLDNAGWEVSAIIEAIFIMIFYGRYKIGHTGIQIDIETHQPSALLWS